MAAAASAASASLNSSTLDVLHDSGRHEIGLYVPTIDFS